VSISFGLSQRFEPWHFRVVNLASVAMMHDGFRVCDFLRAIVFVALSCLTIYFAISSSNAAFYIVQK
jgi:hypothetical protein